MIDAHFTLHGIKFWSLRADRAFNLIYAYLIQRVEKPEEFDRELNAPLPQETSKPPRAEDVEAEREEFGAFLATMTGGPPTGR